MVAIVYIIMALSFVAVAAKLSINKWHVSLFYIVVYVLFCLWAKEYAIEGVKQSIEGYLLKKETRDLFAILVTIEAAVLIAFAFRTPMKNGDPGVMTVLQKTEEWAQKVVNFIGKYYVTLLIFPSVFMLETETIYAFPGVDFTEISLALSALIVVFCSVVPWLIRRVLPLKRMREDFILFCSILMSVVALFATNDSSIVYARHSETGENRGWQVVAILFVLFVLFVIGFLKGKQSVCKHNKTGY